MLYILCFIYLCQSFTNRCRARRRPFVQFLSSRASIAVVTIKTARRLCRHSLVGVLFWFEYFSYFLRITLYVYKHMLSICMRFLYKVQWVVDIEWCSSTLRIYNKIYYFQCYCVMVIKVVFNYWVSFCL